MNGAHSQPCLHGTSKNKMLSFIYPKITNHRMYGSTFGDLVGDVPFISLSSKPRNCNVQVLEQTYVESLARQFLIAARCLWEESLDEEILEQLQNIAQMVAFMCPSHAAHRNKEFIFMVKLWTILKSSYDMLDVVMEDVGGHKFTADEFENSKFAEMLRAVGRSLGKDSDSAEDDFPSVLPRFKAVLPYVKAFAQELKQGIPDYKSRSKSFKKESEKGFYSVLSMAGETESNDGPASSFSISVIKGRTHLELGAFLNEADIPAEIRKGDNFKGFMNAVSDAFASMYSVFELKKDIELERTKHSAILKLVGNGMPLQNAFELYLGRVQNSLNAVQETAKMLLMSNPGDINIEKYIECAQDFLNGQLYWYAHTNGYTIN